MSKTLHIIMKLAVAQLVERWTVAANLKSIGRWFDSGLRDTLAFWSPQHFVLAQTAQVVFFFQLL